jgi:hypothetical protein
MTQVWFRYRWSFRVVVRVYRDEFVDVNDFFVCQMSLDLDIRRHRHLNFYESASALDVELDVGDV